MKNREICSSLFLLSCRFFTLFSILFFENFGFENVSFCIRTGIYLLLTGILKLEVIEMTTKELLYIEDALGHEQYFQTKCKETISQIQDGQLKSCLEQMAQKHQQIFQNFYGLL